MGSKGLSYQLLLSLLLLFMQNLHKGVQPPCVIFGGLRFLYYLCGRK